MPLRSIIVPLDGSKLAEHALPIAGAIARAARARLRLVLVHQLPPPPTDKATAKLYVSIEVALRKSQRAYLRRLAVQLAKRSGVKVTAASLTGPVAETLIEWIDETDPDLVVMTTHGRGVIERALLGSVADRLVRTLELPIILLRPPADDTAPASEWTPREIVVGLDGSRLAEAALPPAVELARLFRAPLMVLQVIEPLPVVADPPLSFATGYDQRITESLRREAQDYLDSMAEVLREDGLQASGVARLGWSAAGVMVQLTPERAGLIAIATHGRGGLKRALLGSVADKLIRTAQCPVLVVRPKGRRSS